MSYVHRVIMDYPLGFWRLSNKDYENRILNMFPAKETNAGIEIDNVYSWFQPGFEDGTFTAEFWVEPSNLSNFGFIAENIFDECSIGVTSVNNGKDIIFAVGPHIAIKNIDGIKSKINIYCVYNQKTIQVYVNGVPSEQVDLGNDFKFGYSIKRFIASNIEDLAFFGRKLSSNEIKAHLSWESYEFKEHNEVLSDFFEDVK